MFNGHPSFTTTGATDNPRIGTTEEWALYSVLADHPVHIHLINYQVVGYTSLKIHSSGCYYARLDFYINSGILNCSKMNCSDLDKVCEIVY